MDPSVIPLERRDAPSGPEVATNIDLRTMIRRWLRGFHAALYSEPLIAATSKFMTVPPLPEVHLDPGGRTRVVPIHPLFEQMVAVVRGSRQLGLSDSISFYNGRCRYECVWTTGDNDEPLCVWALDVYDWKRLGSDVHAPWRGCAGLYYAGHLPERAALRELPEELFLARGLDPFQ